MSADLKLFEKHVLVEGQAKILGSIQAGFVQNVSAVVDATSPYRALTATLKADGHGLKLWKQLWLINHTEHGREMSEPTHIPPAIQLTTTTSADDRDPVSDRQIDSRIRVQSSDPSLVGPYISLEISERSSIYVRHRAGDEPFDIVQLVLDLQQRVEELEQRLVEGT